MTDSIDTKEVEYTFTLAAGTAKALAAAARLRKIEMQIYEAATQGKGSVEVQVDLNWTDREYIFDVIKSGGYKLLGGYKHTSKVTIDWR